MACAGRTRLQTAAILSTALLALLGQFLALHKTHITSFDDAFLLGDALSISLSKNKTADGPAEPRVTEDDGSSLQREVPSGQSEDASGPQIASNQSDVLLRREAAADQSEVTTSSPSATAASMNPRDMLLPVPVIVMGLPKAGTTSVGAYFRCGFGEDFMHRVSHYDCHPDSTRPIEKQTQGALRSCGTVIMNNKIFDRPIFSKIDMFDVYSEIDAIQEETIVFPQVRFISQIYEAYPNATWILNKRQRKKWVESLERAGLRQKIVASRVFNRQYGELKTFGVGKTDEEMIDFYRAQGNFIRTFARGHPSVHLVEVAIDEPNAGEVLERSFGIRKECWGQKNANRIHRSSKLGHAKKASKVT